MKTVIDSHDSELDLHELCYLIYQGFGQRVVEEFATLIEAHGENIVWAHCEPCESTTPIYASLCLVCATPTIREEQS